MRKKEKCTLSGVGFTFAIVAYIIWLVVQIREGITDVSGFIVSLFSNPLAILVYLFLGIVIWVCRDDLKVLGGALHLFSSRPKGNKKERLAIRYDPVRHLDDQNQRVTFDVVHMGNSRVQQIHTYIESLTAITKLDDPGQLAVQFTEHELSPTREPEKNGYRLDPGQPKNMTLCWSAPDDPNIYFSGYDVNGKYREEGFNTVKATYEARIVVTSRNATEQRATFRIGYTDDGRLTCEQVTTRSHPSNT